MSSSETEYDDGALIIPIFPDLSPSLFKNARFLLRYTVLAWLSVAAFGLLKKLGLPVHILGIIAATTFVWLLVASFSFACVHIISVRWVRVPLMIVMALPNLFVCLSPTMLLDNGLDASTPPVSAVQLTGIWVLLFVVPLFHCCAMFFLLAPKRFERVARRIPLLGPFFEKALLPSPSSSVTDDDGQPPEAD